MKFINLVAFILILFGLGSPPLQAQQETCLTQLEDENLMMKSKREGLFREPLPRAHSTFSYNTEQAYSDYLTAAYLEISSENPRATLPCPVYTDTYKQLVAQGSRPANATVADLISPFELTQKQSRKAMLLIHGLTDSPFTYHDLAQVYYQQGYTVRTLLLPGHGTAPGALKEINADDWHKASTYAIERTLKDFDQVILGGYSTGAAIIIDYLTQGPVDKHIIGAMLFSPATEPHNKNGWLAKWVNAIPFINWIDKDADLDFAKYESFPFNAASASYEAMKRISLDKLKHRSLPDVAFFSTFSDVDTTIDNQVTFKLLAKLHNPKTHKNSQLNRLVYYGDDKNIPNSFPADYLIISDDCDTEDCKNIQGMSHIGIVNKPSNPHYGRTARYRNCGSYLDDDTLYKACKYQPEIVIGERTAENLAKYKPFARLTFNPYFDKLSLHITDFIKDVERASEQ